MLESNSRKPVIHLNRNEFYYPHPDGVLAPLKLAQQQIHRYVSTNKMQELHSSLSAHIGVDKSALFFGSGAEDLILKIMAWQCGKKQSVTIPNFSWNNYKRIAVGFGYPVHIPHCNFISEGGYEFSSQALKQHLKQTPSTLCVLGSPSNPTGHKISSSDIHELAKEFPQHTFIFDAVYDNPQKASHFLTEEHENIILLGSFSKFYGVPGLRLGYAVGNLPTGFQTELGLQPWLVGSALNAIAHSNYYSEVHREISIQVKQTTTWINENHSEKFKAFNSEAPFVLVESIQDISQPNFKLAIEKSGVEPKLFTENGRHYIRFGMAHPKAEELVKQYFFSL